MYCDVEGSEQSVLITLCIQIELTDGGHGFFLACEYFEESLTNHSLARLFFKVEIGLCAPVPCLRP